ncbi:unnamed protein product [Kuraishia capsulata CBS 1993]|uniref:Xylanolytic transcriptional activator regulatory domain-containing protein n=1 Tax=Kuraishia capsulata CBS 1993 TaxID=1382522 RepID=W6MUX5_9ASCO|nr:uncharacterized protein KUCA_T00005615001 [Kuraishia capsulata CBS 1993]CDK29622.1 unnamed protein product [Kuraishia capsulata CBS 1993]
MLITAAHESSRPVQFAESCDKTKPVCNICRKNNASHQCVYLEPSWVKTTTNGEAKSPLKQEQKKPSPLAEIRYKLRKLEASMAIKDPETNVGQIDPEETMEFYPKNIKFDHVNCTVATMFGALSLKGVIQKDPILNALRDRFSTKSVKEKISEPVGDPSADLALEKKFRSRLLETILKDDLSKEPLSQNDKHKRTPLAKLYLSRNKVRVELEIVERVSGVAPPKKAAWLLIDRYFKFVHPFFPCMDQELFLGQMRNMIGPRSSEDVPIQFNIERRMDLLTLALFFVVIRFAYLTFFDGGVPIDAESDEMKYLLAHAVKEHVIVAAQICVTPFQLLKLCTLEYIQIALHLKVYQQLAPEEGDVADSQVLTGMIYQMAISIGMNRDPSGHSEFQLDHRGTNLWRKMWYTIISFDTFNGFLLDRLPPVVTSYFDTRLPNFGGVQNANNLDLTLEKETIDNMLEKRGLDERYKAITNMALDIRNPPKVTSVIDAVNDLEAYLLAHYSGYADLLTPSNGIHVDNVRKAKRVMQYTDCCSLVITVLYHLFLHFESQQNASLSFHFLQKCLTMSFEVSTNCCSLLNRMKVFFGPGLEPIVTPTIQFALQSMFWLQYSIYLRCKHCMYYYTVQGNLYPDLKQKFDLLAERSRHTIKVALYYFRKNAKRNYFAWRTVKLQLYITERVKQVRDCFFNPDTHQTNAFVAPRSNIFFKYSTDQLDDLYTICSLDRISFYGPQESEVAASLDGDGVSGLESLDSAWFDVMVHNQLDQFLGDSYLSSDLAVDRTGFLDAPLGDFSFRYM